MKNFIIGLCVFIAAMIVSGCGGGDNLLNAFDGSTAMMDGGMDGNVVGDGGMDAGMCRTLTIGASDPNLSIVYNGGLVVTTSSPIVLRSILINDVRYSSSYGFKLLDGMQNIIGDVFNHVEYMYAQGLLVTNQQTITNADWTPQGTVTLCF